MVISPSDAGADSPSHSIQKKNQVSQAFAGTVHMEEGWEGGLFAV
jgi:hypothetical protein